MHSFHISSTFPHLDRDTFYRYGALHMNKEDLYTTAALAALSLSKHDEETVGAAFEEMLQYFEIMKDIDVENLEPTTHALLKNNRVRKDESVSDDDMTERLLKNAPELDGRFITIPSVL